MSLILLEQIAWLLEPGVFGKVIDAMLAHQQHEPRTFEVLLLHLTVWLAIFVGNSTAGVLRRIATARVSTRLYTDLVAALMTQALSCGEAPERTAAKAELSREIVQAFESRLPMFIAGVVNVIGALIALYAFDGRIATACLALLPPLALVNRRVNRSLGPLERTAHDLREQAFSIFAAREPERTRDHFARLAATQQRIGMLSSVNFFSLRSALLVLFVVVLYIAIDIDDLSTGHLYAVVSYLWTFVAYAEDIPQLVESGTSLADLFNRLGRHEPSAGDDATASA